MTFDGRRYSGAAVISPQAYSSGAPAIGDLLLQTQISGFFSSRHRSKMIGNQTYPHRQVHRAPVPTFTASSGVDVAEWPDVYMPAHATHIGVQVYFEHPEGEGIAIAHHKVIVTDGTNTDTGAEFDLNLEDSGEPAEFTSGSVRLFSASAFVELSTVTQPGAVLVRLIGHARDVGGSHNYAYTPRAATAWRWTA